MNRIKISVLVPVYNVEPYLAACLDSLLAQTLRDIEIICINDGSTDNSLAILQDYAQRDRRIVILDKPNTGYGDSMNLGLKKSHGEYISILEPDDWLDPDGLKTLYDLAAPRQPDVVKANFFQERQGHSTLSSLISPEDSGKIINPRHFPAVFLFAPSIWSAIYRRDFLTKNRINFLPTPGASYQDLGFSFKVWSCATKVLLTSQAFLHYRLDNNNSSVNNPGKVNCVVDEYAEIETFLTERGIFQEFGGIMVAAKFRNYHWNLQRLAPALAAEFYQVMRQELLAAAEEGIIDRQYFSSSEWLALQTILKHPDSAYRLLRLRGKLRKHHS